MHSAPRHSQSVELPCRRDASLLNRGAKQADIHSHRAALVRRHAVCLAVCSPCRHQYPAAGSCFTLCPSVRPPLSTLSHSLPAILLLTGIPCVHLASTILDPSPATPILAHFTARRPTCHYTANVTLHGTSGQFASPLPYISLGMSHRLSLLPVISGALPLPPVHPRRGVHTRVG